MGKIIKNIFSLIVSLFLLSFLLLSTLFNTNSKDLGDGFIYNGDNRHILGPIDIPPPNIITYNYDEHFITVKQKPQAYDNVIYDTMKYHYPQGRDTIYYWLIVKKEKKIFGPLNYNDFKKVINKYNLSIKLRLK